MDSTRLGVSCLEGVIAVTGIKGERDPALGQDFLNLNLASITTVTATLEVKAIKDQLQLISCLLT